VTYAGQAELPGAGPPPRSPYKSSGCTSSCAARWAGPYVVNRSGPAGVGLRWGYVSTVGICCWSC